MRLSRRQIMEMNTNWRNFRLEEVRWPDNQTSRLLTQAFKDARVNVRKVWEKGNHKYIHRVDAVDGPTNVKMELNVISNVIMLKTKSGYVRLGELQPGSRGRKLSKNLKMLSKLPAFGVAGFKGLRHKIESVNDVENIDEKSAASKEAEEQGLVHLGFGRYGPKKGDPATHVSKDGELKPVSDKEPEVDGGEPEDKPFGGDTGKDADYDMGEPDRVPYQDFRSDPTDDDYSVDDDPEIARIPDEKPKEKRPGGRQAEDDYHKADMMMKK